jgi:hypothetical protein
MTKTSPFQVEFVFKPDKTKVRLRDRRSECGQIPPIRRRQCLQQHIAPGPPRVEYVSVCVSILWRESVRKFCAESKDKKILIYGMEWNGTMGFSFRPMMFWRNVHRVRVRLFRENFFFMKKRSYLSPNSNLSSTPHLLKSNSNVWSWLFFSFFFLFFGFFFQFFLPWKFWLIFKLK